MSKQKIQIAVIFLTAVFLITTGFGCAGTPKKLAEKIQPINLVYWRTTDDQGAFDSIINGFHAKYPHVSITYRLIRPEEYEQTLLEAWAEDKGPDIFSIPNTWLRKYQTKISPLNIPDELSLARKVTTGTFKKETKVVEEKKKTPVLRELQEKYVDTVPKDVIIDNKLYGLPLSLDILVLYYNKELLNNAGIVNPPANWQEFADDVRLLTFKDKDGNFVQSGTALGGIDNVANLSDILSLLMLQNGTTMISESGQASFNRPAVDDASYFPGEEALRFYTDFATPGKEIYCWNEKMTNSLDAFIQGKTAFLFGYSDFLPTIKEKAPKLNFDIIKAPQITGSLKEVNFASYPIETISKKNTHPDESWAFLLYATEEANNKTFLEKTKHPTAIRSLIQFQLEDFDLAPFVKGVLTAQTWYQGKNYSLVEESFKEMVRNVLTGTKEIKQALDYCVQKVNLTL
ncbi:MAG: extracellular solute-binding protein [Patescibacteria group bacterium]|nr:extracellular solute-binding protein [Patescibacteria group bacterium]